MASQTWVLTDVERGISENDFSVSALAPPASTNPASTGPESAESWKISRRLLRGGLSDGVDLIEIDNGQMRLLVLPTRGMGIWKAKAGDETLGWQSPVRGPVHPKFVPLTDPDGLGWLEGFDELVVRCGLESNGAPEFDEQGRLLYSLHGKIANRPAHFVELTVDDVARTITLRGLVEETRFHFQKLRLEATVTLSMDSRTFTIQDRVENYGGTPAEMQMLYHINIGEPLLVPGSQIVAPIQVIQASNDQASNDQASKDAKTCTEDWGLIGPPVAGQPEQCYFLKLRADKANDTQVLLKNANGSAGTAIAFNTSTLPCFTVWKNCVASEDGYVTGLEPGTNFPNPRSVEKECGRVVALAPGETWEAKIKVQWLTNAEEVSKKEKAVQRLNDC